jgi:hypothetical protein
VSKKYALRATLRKAEDVFGQTFFTRHQQVFSSLGERSSELQQVLREMGISLRTLPEEGLSKANYREIRRRLIQVIQFSEKYKKADVFDVTVLKQIMLELETEFAAVEPSKELLEGIIRWHNYSKEGE